MTRSMLGAAWITALCCGGMSCGDAHGVREFAASREVKVADQPTKAAWLPGDPVARSSPAAPRGPKLAYDVPSGWTELAPTSMRAANFLAGGDARCECALTLLGGDAGGLSANVQRWRGQMGAPPLDASAVEALPRTSFFGASAAFVDVAGSYTSMGGTAAQSGYRLVGLLSIAPSGSAFLKLTGPADVVERELGAFRALARSFRAEPAPSSDAAQGASATPSATAAMSSLAHDAESSMSNAVPRTSSSGAPSLPNDLVRAGVAAKAAPLAASDAATHAGVGAESAATPSATSSTAAKLAWDLPAGWVRAADRPTRVATFLVGGDPELECSLTTLAGEAGGALANVNRWRKQLQREAMTAAELGALERIDVLGMQAVYVQIEGLAAAGGEPELLLGAVACARGRSVFVKLVGSRERVLAARADVRAFCASLRER